MNFLKKRFFWNVNRFIKRNFGLFAVNNFSDETVILYQSFFCLFWSSIAKCKKGLYSTIVLSAQRWSNLSKTKLEWKWVELPNYARNIDLPTDTLWIVRSPRKFDFFLQVTNSQIKTANYLLKVSSFDAWAPKTKLMFILHFSKKSNDIFCLF